MANCLITKNSPADDAVLNAIAYIPTEHLSRLVEPDFFKKLADEDFVRIGTWLAQKSFDERGCPIGGVIVDIETRQIIGKGHNTLGQENDSTTHGGNRRAAGCGQGGPTARGGAG